MMAVGAAPNPRADGQDRAGRLAKHRLRGRTEDQALEPMQRVGSQHCKIDLLCGDYVENAGRGDAILEHGFAFDSRAARLMAKLVEIVLALLTDALQLQQQPSGLRRRHLGVLEYVEQKKTCAERGTGVEGSTKRRLRCSREVGCNEESLERRDGVARGGLHSVYLFLIRDS